MSEVADGTEARSQSLHSHYSVFTEHSKADNMKKRRTVADSVTSVGESGDLDLGASVASLGVNTRSYIATLQIPE